MRFRLSLLALAGAAALVVPAAPAAADTGPTVRVLDTTVVAPYQLTAGRGALWVADGALSRVSTLTRAGLTMVVDGPHPGEIAGAAVNRRGDLAYTWTAFGSSGSYEDGTSYVTVRQRGGRTLTVDMTAFEAARNPDGGVWYGVRHPTACQQQAFAMFGGARYSGIVHTHPYAVAPLPDGDWAVADAAGNALLRLDRTGRVSVIAVLPRQPVTITAAAAAGLGLPACAVGARYAFEAVPTDIEVGPDGRLIVSLLPGGTGPQLGPNGSVVSVDPRTGAVRTLARGFLGAVNVAVGDQGRIYVSEFFGGRISVLEHGTVRPYVQLAAPLGLVFAHGTLFAGTMAQRDEQGTPTAPGTLVAIR